MIIVKAECVLNSGAKVTLTREGANALNDEPIVHVHYVAAKGERCPSPADGSFQVGDEYKGAKPNSMTAPRTISVWNDLEIQVIHVNYPTGSGLAVAEAANQQRLMGADPTDDDPRWQVVEGHLKVVVETR